MRTLGEVGVDLRVGLWTEPFAEKSQGFLGGKTSSQGPNVYRPRQKRNPRRMARTSGRLSAAFLEGLPPSVLKEVRAWSGDLEQRLDSVVERGRRAWPELSFEVEGWMRYLSRHQAAEAAHDPLVAFAHAEDLYLAYACIGAAPRALEAFEAAHFSRLPVHLSQLSPTRELLNEVEQMLRAKLFTAQPGEEPGIAAYAGRGPLGAWFRVTALNDALKLLRAEGKQERAERHSRAEAAGAPSKPADPEHALIRLKTKSDLQDILKEVLSQAPPRERALLRMHFVEGSTLDELAKIFKVHRATVVRWIGGARRTILAETQRRLVKELKLSPSEVSSTLRMSRSDWTLSLRSLLAPSNRAK